MMRRLIAFMLTLLLVFITGCSGAPPETEPTAAEGEPTAAEAEPTTADAEPTAADETETTDAPAGDGSTLIVGIPDDAATFDMLFATTPRSTQVIMNAYETLMTYGIEDLGDGLRTWDSDSVEGAVLESMEVGDDGLTWTLTVRPGVTFPDGTEITAETVKFMFERNFGVDGSGGAFMYSFVGRIPDIEAVEVIDDMTLEVTTDQPNPLLPRIFVLSNSTPLNPEQIEAQSTEDDQWASEWLQQNTAGAGPYRLVSWTPGVEIILEANENYWQGAPEIERVEMRIIPSTSDRMMLLASENLDLIEKLSAEEIDAVSRMPGLKVISIPSTVSVELVMNNQIEPFSDLRVRQAMAYAIPYSDIIETVYFERAQRSAGPIPVDFPGHDPGEYPYDQDLDQARELLEEAGYADGLTLDLEIDSGNPDHEPVAVLIRDALAEVGVETTIQQLTPAVFAERRAEGDIPFFLNDNSWWVDDPLYPLQLGYTTGAFFNYPGYANSELDEQIAAAASELDETARSELISEIQQQIIADVPLIWIAHPNFNLAMRENVDGYVHFNDNMVRYYYFRKE